MRYELTDHEWTAIRPMPPNKPRGVPRVKDRRVLNGIFWVLRSGAPWRDLPTVLISPCPNLIRLVGDVRTDHLIMWRTVPALGVKPTWQAEHRSATFPRQFSGISVLRLQFASMARGKAILTEIKAQDSRTPYRLSNA